MIHPSQLGQGSDGRPSGTRIVVDRRGHLTCYLVRPWLFISVVALFLAFGIGYLASTGYLFYRDGLMETAKLQLEEMEYGYEKRLSAMRTKIDRLTSRQIVQSQGIKAQVSTLLDQQEMIDRRQLVLDTLITKARTEGISVVAATAPLPRPKPKQSPHGTPDPDVVADQSSTDSNSMSALSYVPAASSEAVSITGTVFRDKADALLGKSAQDHLEDDPEIPLILEDLRSSLDDAAVSQEQALRALVAAADREADRMQAVLAKLNVPAPRAPAKDEQRVIDELEEAGLGGPFIPAPISLFVEDSLAAERAIDHLRLIRRAGREVPVGNPVPGARASSSFGYRRDPFTKRRAFHSGLDFRAKRGTPVRATAPGKVTFAGRRGGYGKMVEIRHAHGLITRYAHLSSIKVRRGASVSSGQVVGKVGSTGRSTGPHLHYETRSGKTALNPRRFMAAAGAF